MNNNHYLTDEAFNQLVTELANPINKFAGYSDADHFKLILAENGICPDSIRSDVESSEYLDCYQQEDYHQKQQNCGQ